MATLPKAVQKHQDELDEIERQLQAPGGEGEDTNTAGQTGDDNQGDEANRGDEPPRDQTGGSDDATPSDQNTGSKSDEDDEELWQHKYQRLQGKYNAEVPRLHEEVRQLKQYVQQLQEQQQSQSESQQQADSQSTSRDPLVTDKDVDAFGDDLIDLQRRVAKEVASEFQSELDRLREQNKQLSQQVTQVQGTSFEARLNQAVPDFQEVNSDPKWIEWLDTFDPMIQGTRRSMAEQAYQQGNVEAVKAYVDLFKQHVGAEASQQQSANNAKAEAKQDRQAELQRQVQPTKSNAPATPQQGKSRVLSQQEFERGMNKAAKLMQQGKYDEAAALESEMSTAVAEGRVSS